MKQTLDQAACVSAAESSAAAAADRAGVQIRELHAPSDLHAAATLLSGIWARRNGAPLIAPDLLRALSHAGNYVAAAYHDDEMVGAATGFLGLHHDRVGLHSHVLGVRGDLRSRHVGFALKQHQRAWALGRDIDTVTWTFDPLVRRNAYFNLGRLGADAAAYHPNFYGVMEDEFNDGDESDRLVALWTLDGDKARRASEGRLPEPDIQALIDGGACVALDADEQGRPVATQPEPPTTLCRIPEDIVAIRNDDAGLAHDWRMALRETLGAAMRQGARPTAFARSGWYVVAWS